MEMGNARFLRRALARVDCLNMAQEFRKYI
jgi:hypothetical protein